MLETCEFQKKKETVYRLACLIPYKSIQNRLTELGLSATPVNVDKISNLLNRLSVPLTTEEVIDDAFQPKTSEVTPFPEFRFSDGTIGVYYSAIEVTTCKREIEYHLRIQIAENGSEEIKYTRKYQLIKCNYSGATVDLRGQEKIIMS